MELHEAEKLLEQGILKKGCYVRINKHGVSCKVAGKKRKVISVYYKDYKESPTGEMVYIKVCYKNGNGEFNYKELLCKHIEHVITEEEWVTT